MTRIEKHCPHRFIIFIHIAEEQATNRKVNEYFWHIFMVRRGMLREKKINEFNQNYESQLSSNTVWSVQESTLSEE